MQKDIAQAYRCPYTGKPLTLQAEKTEGDGRVVVGRLVGDGGIDYPVAEGLPIFLDEERLLENELSAIDEYDGIVSYYDNAIDWLFASFYENENAVRGGLVDQLEIGPTSRVLEVGCGTGRDSIHLAARLSKGGELFVQDISRQMVSHARTRVAAETHDCDVHFFVSSATHLPHPDGYFDAVYTFGSFNEFPNPKATLRELMRVVKLGGKVLIGDENIAPWLDDTEYADIIKTNNPIFRRTALPLEHLPPESQDVCLRWVIGNCFYSIDFRVAEDAPKLNLDLPHKGWRGGSLRTRYFGQLEGVTPETKMKVIAAAKARGLSVHEWLEETFDEALKK